MRGQQLGWVCLGSCGADVCNKYLTYVTSLTLSIYFQVTLNAIVLYWVTSSTKNSIASCLCVKASIKPTSDSSYPSPTGHGFSAPALFSPPRPTPHTQISATNTSSIDFVHYTTQPEDHKSRHTTSLEGSTTAKSRHTASLSSVHGPSMPAYPTSLRRSQSPARETLRSVRRFFGFPPEHAKKDLEVQVTIATQHEIELDVVDSEGPKAHADGYEDLRDER